MFQSFEAWKGGKLVGGFLEAIIIFFVTVILSSGFATLKGGIVEKLWLGISTKVGNAC